MYYVRCYCFKSSVSEGRNIYVDFGGTKRVDCGGNLSLSWSLSIWIPFPCFGESLHAAEPDSIREVKDPRYLLSPQVGTAQPWNQKLVMQRNNIVENTFKKWVEATAAATCSYHRQQGSSSNSPGSCPEFVVLVVISCDGYTQWQQPWCLCQTSSVISFRDMSWLLSLSELHSQHFWRLWDCPISFEQFPWSVSVVCK